MSIGAEMARREIKKLLADAETKQDEPQLDTHCPDHQFQRRVNYAMLLGMSALLEEKNEMKRQAGKIGGILGAGAGAGSTTVLGAIIYAIGKSQGWW